MPNQSCATSHHLHTYIINQKLGQQNHQATLDYVYGSHSYARDGTDVTKDVGSTAIVVAKVPDVLTKNVTSEYIGSG